MTDYDGQNTVIQPVKYGLGMYYSFVLKVEAHIMDVICNVVDNWDGYEALWEFAQTSFLNSSLKDHPLLLAEPMYNPPEDRERFLFSSFK